MSVLFFDRYTYNQFTNKSKNNVDYVFENSVHYILF